MKSVDIHSPPGTKLIFHGEGGYAIQREAAKELLTVGETYTLKSAAIYDWHTDFYLEEVEKRGGFNSTMFSPAED